MTGLGTSKRTTAAWASVTRLKLKTVMADIIAIAKSLFFILKYELINNYLIISNFYTSCQ
jgi:hypothetical protein